MRRQPRLCDSLFRGRLAIASLLVAVQVAPACGVSTEPVPCDVAETGPLIDDAGDEAGEVLVSLCAVPFPPRIS